MFISFVIPVYNEEDTLPELERRLGALMDGIDGTCEAILVDDGSRDESHRILLAMRERDERLKIAKLSRNFGHQIAITAGLDLAAGDAVVIMDADLQDPPEVVHEMIERWQAGYDVVYGLRSERQNESWFKRATAAAFYALLKRLTASELPRNVGDFRLVDRRVVHVLRMMRERNRYVRGMFAWVGFRQTGVAYTRHGRYAGKTKYTLRRMWKLAVDAIAGFSTAPLKLALNLGFAFSVLAFVWAGFALLARMLGVYTVPGWSSLLAVIAFLGGIQLLVMGIAGEYIGRIYAEAVQRPLYIISDAAGLDDAVLPGGGMVAPKRALLTDAPRKGT